MTEEKRTCPVCNFPLVEGCQNGVGTPPHTGGGIIPVIQEDGTSIAKVCPNMRRLKIRRHLESIDPLLVAPGLQHDRTSKLYQPKSAVRKTVRDLTKKNLLIRRIEWEKFLAHLKWVAGCKGTGWFCRVTSDMTLLNIFVGNTAMKARLPSQRTDSGELLVMNSLEDYLESPDLVIIRVGHVIHPNKAAANVMQETLRLRAMHSKPTWIVEPPDRSYTARDGDYGFATGMVSCDESVLAIIEQSFSKVALKTEVEVPQGLGAKFIVDDDSGDVQIGDEPPSDFGVVAAGVELDDLEGPDDSDTPEVKQSPVVDEGGGEGDDGAIDDSPLWEESESSKKKRRRW